MPNSKEVDVKSLVRESGISFPSGIIKLKIKPVRKKRKDMKSNRRKPARKRLSMKNKKHLEKVKSMTIFGKKIDIKNNEVVLGGGKRRKRRRKTKKKRKMRKRKTKRRR